MKPDPSKVARLAAVSFAALVVLPSCAHEMAKGALSGVAQGQEATENDPEKQVFRVSAERAVAGAVEALDAPEQRARLNQVITEAVQAAVASAFKTATAVPRGKAAGAEGGVAGVSPVAQLMGQAAKAAVTDALRELVDYLGGHGEGPLATSLQTTGKNVTSAMVGSARDELTALFPTCTGSDALACIDREVQKMSQSAASGFSRGVRDSIGWQLLVVAALLGLLAGALGHWLWSMRSHGRVLRTRTT